MQSDNEKDIFFEALSLDPNDRQPYLIEKCSGDDAMKHRIEQLINAHALAQEFMSDPTIGAQPTSNSTGQNKNDVGGKIGPYTLRSLLGEGGFGRVYLAQQERPITRAVALKVLKAGMDSRAIVSRFEAERQALAVMDHPNVARVFDGGQTASGHPYFVMEYVRGEPITAFCKKNDLTLRRKLELFESVCLAVQHAHHKGIIHRDLKPSNVLVTTVDSVPTPKVIDFGIAKALGPTAGDATQMTKEGHLIGTPSYMSPEQVMGNVGMDTRSDVYTLGVLLYEILTGALPFDSSRIENASATSLVEIICEEIPPRPSTRVMRIESTDSSETRQISTQLRGDLDWIIMRAMEKEPARRYQTAFAFATDIHRYLQNEAVDAGPPSNVYRFKKFAQRHRGEFAATGLVLIALVAGLVSSLVFAARVDHQQKLTARQLEKSQMFADFAVNMLSGLDPAVARGKDTTLLLQILNDAERGLNESPPEFAEVESEMRELLGVAHHRIAKFDAAEELFLTAIELAGEGFDHTIEATLDTARLHHDLGKVYTETTRLDDAKREFEFVRDTRIEHLGPNHPETLTVLFDLGVVDRLMGNYEQARDIFERVLERRVVVLGDRHKDTMSTRNSLATVLDELLEHDLSAKLLREVVEYQLEELGDDHPHTLATQNNLADTLEHLGQQDEAVQILIGVLEIKRRVLEADHPSLIVALNNLGHIYGKMDKQTEAETMIKEALEISTRTLGDRDMRTLVLTNNIAGIYLKTDRPQLAKGALLPMIPIAEDVLSEGHPLVLAMLSHNVGAHRELKEFDEAISIARVLLTRAAETFPADHPNQANHRRLLANTLLEAGEPAAAKLLLIEANEMHSRGIYGSQEDIRNTLESLIKACDTLGEAEESARYSAQLNELPSG